MKVSVEIFENRFISTLVISGGSKAMHQRLRNFRLKALFPPATKTEERDCHLIKQANPQIRTDMLGIIQETSIDCQGDLRMDLIQRLQELL